MPRAVHNASHSIEKRGMTGVVHAAGPTQGGKQMPCDAELIPALDKRHALNSTLIEELGKRIVLPFPWLHPKEVSFSKLSYQ